MLGRAPALSLTLSAIVLAASSALASVDLDPQQSARDVLGAAGYQTHLPGYDEPASSPTTTTPPIAPERRRVLGPSLRETSASSSLAPFANLLLWLFGGAGVLVLALAIAQSVVRWRIRRVPSADAPLGATTGALADPTRWREHSGELASRGQLAEAIHALLLGTIDELKRRRGLVASPASTSRELVAELSLNRDARQAFSGLVESVEITLFGGRRASRAEYEACVHYFDALVNALAPAAA